MATPVLCRGEFRRQRQYLLRIELRLWRCFTKMAKPSRHVCEWKPNSNTEMTSPLSSGPPFQALCKNGSVICAHGTCVAAILENDG